MGTKSRLLFETVLMTTAIPDDCLQLYRTSYSVRSAITASAELLVLFDFPFIFSFVCREKMKLEQEKTQKEADIKIKNGEVLALQKELDAVSNTVKQLEMQKAEAQKRLDELDDKVINTDSVQLT